MGQLFGFQINRKAEKKGQSPVPPLADAPVSIAAGGYFGTYVDGHGDAFEPDEKNLMSYSQKNCRDFLSNEQNIKSV